MTLDGSFCGAAAFEGDKESAACVGEAITRSCCGGNPSSESEEVNAW